MGIFDAAAAVIGAGITAFGSSRAADAVEEADRRAQGITREAKDAALGYLGEGTDRSMAYLAPILNETGNARTAIGAVAARPASVLTPDQQIQLEDTMRDANASLAKSGARGAGRGGVALLNDANRRMRANFYTQNQGRADAARNLLEQRDATTRTGLSSIEAQSGVNKAGVETGAGTKLAALESDIGSANSAGIAGVTNAVSQGLGGALRYITADENKALQLSRDQYGSGGTAGFGGR